MTTTARRPARRILPALAAGLFLAAAVAPAVYHDMPAPARSVAVYHDMGAHHRTR